MERWFYCINGRQEGPVTREVIRDLVARGDLGAETPIWAQGMPRWVKVRKRPELAELLPMTPLGRTKLPWQQGPRSFLMGAILGVLPRRAQGPRK